MTAGQGGERGASAGGQSQEVKRPDLSVGTGGSCNSEIQSCIFAAIYLWLGESITPLGDPLEFLGAEANAVAGQCRLGWVSSLEQRVRAAAACLGARQGSLPASELCRYVVGQS